MGIINSIVVGKGRGKIGNAVLVTLKGQSIIKQLNDAPANPRTAPQVASRGKMSNAVKAWQFLFIFLANIGGLRKSTESNYNAFVRLAKNLFSDVVAASAVLAASQLDAYSVGQGNFVTVLSSELTGAACVVTFNTGGLPFVADSYFRFITFDNASGENVILSKLITELEWAAGISSSPSVVAGMGNNSAYIYNSTASKCSNLCFIGA